MTQIDLPNMKKRLFTKYDTEPIEHTYIDIKDLIIIEYKSNL